MKFELPGLTTGPTDAELDRFERTRLVVRPPSEVMMEEEQAASLGLTVPQFRVLQKSLRATCPRR